MDLYEIATYVLEHKPGVEGKLEVGKLVNKFKKKGVEYDDDTQARTAMRKVADEMLVEYNLEERRKMGDEITIEQIYPIVRNTVSYHRKSLEEYALDEEELIQSVILKVYLNFPRFEGRASLSTWIYRITFNELTNLIIYHNRAKRNIKQSVSFEYSDLEFEADDTIESLIMSEQKIETAEALLDEHLSPRDSQICKLVLRGVDYTDVCDELDVDLSAVRKAVSHAKGIGG